MKNKISIIKDNLIHPLQYIKILYNALCWGIRYTLRCLGISNEYSYLKEYKNINSGKRCFLIGTGPSLTMSDVNKMSGEITFAVNSLVNSFDDMSYVPTYYGLADLRAVDLFYKKAVESNVTTIFVGEGRLKKNDVISTKTRRFPDSRYFYMYKSKSMISNKRKYYVSDDITKMVFDGGTVLYAMMQIAIYMGIKEIYLIGVDCNYAPGVSNFNEFRAASEIKSGGNHIEQLIGFKRMKEYADKKGIKIYNATRGGMLEIFPRVDFDDLFDT